LNCISRTYTGLPQICQSGVNCTGQSGVCPSSSITGGAPIGAIVGGVVAALVVGLLAAFLIYKFACSGPSTQFDGGNDDDYQKL